MRMIAFAGLVLATTLMVSADEPKPDKAGADALKADLKARTEKYMELALPGVFLSDEKDVKDGQVVRLFVVGISTISTTLGLEEGLEIAMERAEESAKTAFVTFLGSKVTVRKNVKNEILLCKDGEETADSGTTKDLGKKVERRTKEFEESATSIVRGLKVVAKDQIGKEKKLVVVYRWESKLADLAAGVGDKLNNPKIDPKKVDPKKTIPDKKIVIDD
jgi:hypothetical protein